MASVSAGQVGCRLHAGPGDARDHPSLRRENDWYLADVLRRELVRQGYREVPEYGWQGDSSEETAWLYALFKTADAIDAEMRRLEAEKRAREAPIQMWCVLREAGPDTPPEVNAEREPGGEPRSGPGEPGELDEDEGYWTSDEEESDLGEAAGAVKAGRDQQPDGYWLQDRVLVDIYAYNEAHAMYLFAIDFTQPLQADHPKAMPFPHDYRVNIMDLLSYLMQASDGSVDIAGAMGRLLSMDLEGYRLVPTYYLALNREELEERQRRQRRQREPREPRWDGFRGQLYDGPREERRRAASPASAGSH